MESEKSNSRVGIAYNYVLNAGVRILQENLRIKE